MPAPTRHKFTVRPLRTEEPLHGGNIELLMDGKPLKNCVSFDFHVEVGGMAEVNVRLIADADIEGQVDAPIGAKP
jgi:hypothetical protein